MRALNLSCAVVDKAFAGAVVSMCTVAVNKKFTYRTSTTCVVRINPQVRTVGVHSGYNYCIPYRLGMLIMCTVKC